MTLNFLAASSSDIRAVNIGLDERAGRDDRAVNMGLGGKINDHPATADAGDRFFHRLLVAISPLTKE